jgi:DNA-binding transcriptional ArsR family regulator
VAGVFFALGDDTRLSVVRKLRAEGGLSATALSDGAKVTRQAIVKHLQVLEGAGLVTREKRGREVLYLIQGGAFMDARTFLDGISVGWDRAIERLRRLVEERGAPPPRRRKKELRK